MELGVARLADLTYPRGEVLADAGNLAERRDVERRQIVRMVGDDVAAVPVRANLERIIVLELQQVGDLAQNARDGEVIQAAGLPSRSGSRGRARRLPPEPR